MDTNAKTTVGLISLAAAVMVVLAFVVLAAPGSGLGTGSTGSLEIQPIAVPNQDLDSDGVLTSVDLCPDTPEDTEVFPNGCSAAQIEGYDLGGDGCVGMWDLLRHRILMENEDAENPHYTDDFRRDLASKVEIWCDPEEPGDRDSPLLGGGEDVVDGDIGSVGDGSIGEGIVDEGVGTGSGSDDTGSDEGSGSDGGSADGDNAVSFLEPNCDIPGLVSYWPLDGGDPVDLAGDNHGLVESNPGVVDGKLGQAFHFDGVDDLVEIDDDPSLTPVVGTYAFWIKADTRLNNEQIISRMVDDDRYAIVMFNNANRLHLITRDGDYQSPPKMAIEDDEWHHVVVSIGDDGAVGYLDGEEHHRDESKQVGLDITQGTLMFFGGDGDGNSATYFEGTLDEVSLWDRVLTPAEVAELYNDGEGAPVCGGNDRVVLI